MLRAPLSPRSDMIPYLVGEDARAAHCERYHGEVLRVLAPRLRVGLGLRVRVEELRHVWHHRLDLAASEEPRRPRQARDS